jgi:endonuclease/exonuclease/phosphatase family metal-dependent hydrolase
MNSHLTRRLGALAILSASVALASAETFRIAAYNVENYLDKPTESRKDVKSDTAKAKVRETILAMKPDVISFEEMGAQSALLELRDSLKAAGLNLPYYEHITGWDTNIHVCLLSRFPITARRPHTNDSFLLSGRRTFVRRGFTEVDIQVNTNFSFTLMGAHLKSKSPTPDSDEGDLRGEEATILREKIDAVFHADPNTKLVVLGDLNDTYDSKSTKTVVGLGKTKLVDTRPAERNGDNTPNPNNDHYSPRSITWTHHFGREDTYSRIDYILLSPVMAKHLVTEETYIPTIPNWGQGSDHRPVLVTISTEKIPAAP